VYCQTGAAEAKSEVRSQKLEARRADSGTERRDNA
jgi:hypothetical protein